MIKEKAAFEIPIKDGKARILLRLQGIKCEVENSAPDFISTKQDEVTLKIELPNDSKISISEFEKSYELKLKDYKKENQSAIFELQDDSIWFDINIDHVKDIWVEDLGFVLESKNSRYLAYYIKELDHQFEWLQPDMKSGEIKTMSISKKKYKVPKISGKETYTASEVIRCADMLNRSIRKIDLRIGGAYVKFNTDKGKLEPLIIGIADKLGYEIESLSKEIILDMEASGENVSHSIFLKDRS
ncbi:MAG: hypothetical protein JJ971_16165 [Balneolaceae bacterium]|nr:hypothetical protein [Balneolaceae bacterium]MBO6547937.1 hypothetical protein [Balneolaceae bacterium]MBO6648450.1 hypothetical protein [Balneolaceae bacterium]